MSLRLVIARQPDGTYRAETGTDGMQWAQWDPRVGRDGFQRVTWSFGAGETFRLAVSQVKLGRACRRCSYLEFEHNIDGEEKAPCGRFE